jgi:glutamate-1-semialdehyde aminotransferase
MEFDANDPEGLSDLLRTNDNDIAAVIVAPEMVRSDRLHVFHDLLAITRRHDAVFILDEVKTGFRIAPGTFHEHVGFVPDLVAFSKALGNGWPVAAVLGRKDVMQSATGMHLSATYHGETSGMAAALATLDILERTDVCGHVWRLGQQLIHGLNTLARYHRVPAQAYGEPLPPMPFLRFKGDSSDQTDRLASAFYEYCFAHGVLFHPRHLWFISYAHSQADILKTLEVADGAFATSAQLIR